MSNAVSDFLAESTGDQHPAFRFANVGDTVAGTIAETPRVVEVRNDKGGTDKRLVIAVTTAEGDTYSVWVKPGMMASALKKALEDVGADGLTVGGSIAVKFDSTKDVGKPSPAKVYTVAYKAPAATTSIDDLLP